jgi:RecA-family ATPase
MTLAPHELVPLMEPVARRLLGEPNRRMSKQGELRFGNNGSLSVDLMKGTYYDHEAKRGGGVLDLIEAKTGARGAELFRWLEQEGLGGDSSRPKPKPNGDTHSSKLGREVATYDYTDAEGNLLYQVVRFEPKTFRQRRPDGNGGWIWKRGQLELVPYRLPEIVEAIASERLIAIVEGEKDADALWQIGIPATCNPGGAGKWHYLLNKYFEEADAVVLNDHDEAGRKHAADVAYWLGSSIGGAAKRIRMLDLAKHWSDMPDKADVSDWLTAGHSREQLDQLIANAPDYQEPSNKSDNDALPQLAYVDLARDPIPERKWAVSERIPAGNVTLLSGEGAIGKTILLLQLAVAHVLGRDWIGTLPEPGSVLYLSCEDDADEICRRIELIAQHYSATRLDLINHGLRVISRVGLDSMLGVPDRAERIQPTPLFAQLKAEIAHIKPVSVIIDTAADVFAGNEISRAQTRQFVTLLRSLVLDTGSAAILSAHPSLTGIASGSGLSGSTAWHNSVRARLYFKPAPDVEDNDLRVLEVMKNNYGPKAESILLRWKNGVYVPEPHTGSLEQMAADRRIDDLFLDLLDRFASEGRNVSPNRSLTYAPTKFEDTPEAKAAKVKSKILGEAMERLFATGKIKAVYDGPPSKQRMKLVRC